MAKNFVLEKLATIFKGPWMTYWRVEGKGRASVRTIIIMRVLVYQTIPDKVVKRHNIGAALRAQRSVGKKGNEVSEKLYKVAFGVELDQEAAFKLISKIEDAWATAGKKARDRRKEAAILGEIEEHFQKELIELLGEENNYERVVYWKFLEPVIRVAEKKGDTTTAMAEVAQMFKTKDVSRLAAVALKWEARAARRGVINLEHDKTELTNVLNQLNKGKKKANVDNAVGRLKEVDKKIIEDAKGEFKSTYLLYKRDLLMDLVLLSLLNKDDEEMRAFVEKNFMPRTPELKEEKKITQIKEDIAEHGHTIAQGLRRLIADESKLRKKAEKQLVEAKRLRAAGAVA